MIMAGFYNHGASISFVHDATVCTFNWGTHTHTHVLLTQDTNLWLFHQVYEQWTPKKEHHSHRRVKKRKAKEECEDEDRVVLDDEAQLIAGVVLYLLLRWPDASK